MDDTSGPCAVCHEPVEPHTDSLCGACGETFHLNQREDLPGKDCGAVWINQEHFGLEFTCQRCIDAAQREPEQPGGVLADVLDLGEAAAVAGLDEEQLRALAEAGQVPHRAASGGVLLFERKTLMALRGGGSS